MTIRNGIKCIAIRMIRCFLVPCGCGYSMIDTNMPGTYDRFLDKLGGLGIDLGDIKYLLLTHHHDDHVGFAADLLRDTDARVIAHELAVPILHRGQTRNPFKDGHGPRAVLESLDAVYHGVSVCLCAAGMGVSAGRGRR